MLAHTTAAVVFDDGAERLAAGQRRRDGDGQCPTSRCTSAGSSLWLMQGSPRPGLTMRKVALPSFSSSETVELRKLSLLYCPLVGSA